MSNKLRHWKQQFDPTAQMVFRKRVTVFGKQVEPKQPLTQELIRQIGIHKLRAWWESGLIELAPIALEQAAEATAELPTEEDDGLPEQPDE